MKLTIRKIVTYKETILVEGGRDAPRPLDIFAAAGSSKTRGPGAALSRICPPKFRLLAPFLASA